MNASKNIDVKVAKAHTGASWNVHMRPAAKRQANKATRKAGKDTLREGNA